MNGNRTFYGNVFVPLPVALGVVKIEKCPSKKPKLRGAFFLSFSVHLGRNFHTDGNRLVVFFYDGDFIRRGKKIHHAVEFSPQSKEICSKIRFFLRAKIRPCIFSVCRPTEENERSRDRSVILIGWLC